MVSRKIKDLLNRIVNTENPLVVEAYEKKLAELAVLPLLLILTTAVRLAFPDKAQELLLEPFRGETYSLDFAENLDSIAGEDSGTWLPVLQRAAASFPNAEIRTAQVPNDFSPYRIVGLQQRGELHSQGLSKVYIEASGGWMDIRIDSQAQHVSERLYNLAHPLHTGRFDNVPYKIYLTLAGLLVMTLAVFGLISFIKSNPLRFHRS